MFLQLSFTIPKDVTEMQRNNLASQTGVRVYMQSAHIQTGEEDRRKNKFKYVKSITTAGMPLLIQNGASADSGQHRDKPESKLLHFTKLFQT